MKKIASEFTAPPLQTAFPLQLGSTPLLVFTWAATLLVSNLPDILLKEFHLFPNLPLPSLKLALLTGFIALGFVWEVARPLRRYFVMFLVLLLANMLADRIGTTAAWQSGFSAITVPFSRSLFSSQLLRLGVAIVMLAAVWLLTRRRDFFLALGSLNATAEPVRWIGMDKPMGWKRFGLILTLCISLGTLAFTFIFGRVSSTAFATLPPLIPVILVLAAMNAFSEEMAYRAALLSPLHPVLGKAQSLLLTGLLFGLWHFYGVPYGVLGVVMAGVLGWLLGKSMLETRGMFWAWFIHFWQDVVIFTFLAAGSITPGG